MGVVQTSELYKGFIFDGIDSKGFGVYITGSGVYNAPEREVEMIDIPGRNGSYILDKGRFHNITVTYPAGMFGDEEDDFAEGIRKLRNALASRKGYCRLVDEYHPNEYRMASYKGGLEVEPAAVNGEILAGQFNIVFDCMPQRFLIDGDNPVEVSDGGDIFNPTLFDARPLLQVWGHGSISINGETVSVINGEEIGDLILTGETVNRTVTFPTASINTGDTIAMLALTGAGSARYNLRFSVDTNYPPDVVTYSTTSDLDGIVREFKAEKGGMQLVMYLKLNDFDALYGTNKGSQATFTVDVSYTNNGETVTATIVYRLIVEYSGDQFSMRFIRLSGGSGLLVNDGDGVFVCGKIYAHSTKSALGEPLYFDMDIGEAYKEEGGEIVSVNNAVSFPAELPTLKPGANEITFDDTVTKLEIVPRWWEV